MAKKKKAPKPPKEKTATQKKWDARKDAYESVPDSERNPKHKADFDTVLSKLFPPVKPKARKYPTKTKKKKKPKQAPELWG